ncbi:MAG: mechanosensitive ion channel family protein [Muribaculaceae bacterium]|nr:mechanosensitive ion channel family protein [Muribaculaceae bacterium]
MFESILSYLSETIVCDGSDILIKSIILAGIFAVAVAVYFLSKYLLRGIERLVLRTPTSWDDALINPRFLAAVAQLAPAIAVSWMLPGFFGDSQQSFRWLNVLTSVYILWAVVRVFTIFLTNLYEALAARPRLRMYAVKGIFQMLKLICIGIGIIICISLLLGKTPVAILTALGASAAVLSLVFKDTILGLVASIQLSANEMLHRGDWIVVDKAGVNGEVIDVTLTTVKVRNWDNSVSTIPPYSLISDSFRNFRPMQDAGARRVSRSIYIDVDSVRYCTPEELADLAARGWISTDEAAGRTVNLGLFRRYLEEFIGSHPKVRADLTYMVRQMEPTPSGLPVELYFFSAVTEWKKFEHIQSEIFDHVYAMVALFGLRIFQTPAGTDVRTIAEK